MSVLIQTYECRDYRHEYITIRWRGDAGLGINCPHCEVLEMLAVQNLQISDLINAMATVESVAERAGLAIGRLEGAVQHHLEVYDVRVKLEEGDAP